MILAINLGLLLFFGLIFAITVWAVLAHRKWEARKQAEFRRAKIRENVRQGFEDQQYAAEYARDLIEGQ